MNPHELAIHAGQLPRLEQPRPSRAPQVWPLRPGVNRIGSDPLNDICLELPGVSRRHCEIVVGDHACTLIDLNSDRGTWLNDQRIQTAALHDGDLITVGEATFRFLWGGHARTKLRIRQSATSRSGEQGPATENQEPPSPPAEAPPMSETPPLPPPVASESAAAQIGCAQHPWVPARYSCPRCGGFYCEACASAEDARGLSTAICPVCHVSCLPMPGPVPRSQPAGAGWLRALWQTLFFPATTDGMAVLAAGTILLWLVQIASAFSGVIPILGALMNLFLTLVWVTMTFSFLQSVIHQTALGSDRMPDLPDFGDLSTDLWVPLWQFLCLVVLAMPGLLRFVPGVTTASWPPWIWILTWGWTVLYLPMGLLVLSLFNTVRALDPRVVVRSILRTGPLYLAWVLWLAGLAGVTVAVMALLGLIPVGVIALLLQDFVLFYALLCAGRALGLLYRFKKDDLCWKVG